MQKRRNLIVYGSNFLRQKAQSRACYIVLVTHLQEYDDESTQGLDETELQRRLLAEAQESNRVSSPSEAASPVHAGSSDRPAA